VFLRRRPEEALDLDSRAFHHDLLAAVAASGMRGGRWQRVDTSGWPDNDSHRELLAWGWDDGAARHAVVVNLADRPVQAHVHLPWADLGTVTLRDILDGTTYVRDIGPGLFVDLDPGRWHVLAVEP
jgi:hypothetical protein